MPGAAATENTAPADRESALTVLLGRLLQPVDPARAQWVRAAPERGQAYLKRLVDDGVLARRQVHAASELDLRAGRSLCVLDGGRPLLVGRAADDVWTVDLGDGSEPRRVRAAALHGIFPCRSWSVVAGGDDAVAGAPARWGLAAYLKFVAQTLGLATPIAMMLIIDKVVTQGARNTLIVLLIGVALLTVFQYLFTLCHTLLVCREGEVAPLPPRRRVLERLLDTPAAARWRSLGWDVIHGCNDAARFAVETRPQLAADGVFVALLAVLMGVFSPRLLAVSLAFVPLYVLVEAATARRSDRAAAGCTALRNRLSTEYSEAVAAAELIRGLDLGDHTLARWQALDVQLARARWRMSVLRRLSAHGVELLQKLSLLLIMLLGVSSVLAGAMTLGQYIAFNLLSMQLAQPVLRLAAFRRARHDHRLAEDSERALEAECRREPWPAAGSVRLPETPPTVEVDDLRLAGAAGRTVRLLLRPGLWLGISGPSGCGKTTLLRTIAGLHAPANGRVLIGGVPVSQLETSQRARLIRLVPQDAVVFSTTLGENIRLGDLTATPRQILEAALACGLGPLLEQLPEHLNTPVGDAGRRLSGGERQRVAMARAVLSRPPVLLLDEATAGLDRATEAALLASLQQLLPEAAVVLVSHRASSLAFCHERLDLGRAAPSAGPRSAELVAT